SAGCELQSCGGSKRSLLSVSSVFSRGQVEIARRSQFILSNYARRGGTVNRIDGISAKSGGRRQNEWKIRDGDGVSALRATCSRRGANVSIPDGPHGRARRL